MNALKERDIERLLTRRERPEPPAGLAERIKGEIPDEITLVPAPGDTAEAETARPKTVPMFRSRMWLMAASVVLALGGGIFALRVWQQMTPEGAAPLRTADARAGGRLAARGSVGEDAEAPEARVQARAQAPTTEAPGETLGEAAGAKDDAPAAAEQGRFGEKAAEPADGKSADADAGPAASSLLAARVAEPETGSNEPVGRPGQESQVVERKNEMRRELREIYESRDRMDAVPEAEPISVSSDHPLVDAVEPPLARQSQTESSDVSKQVVEQDEQIAFRGASARVQPAPEPAVAPAPPVPPAPPSAPAPREAEKLKSLGYVSSPQENLQVERYNARIAPMRKEAKKLEEELKALGEVPKPQAAPPSTGGTAEPNDAPYGDMFFDSAGVNPFVDTEDDAKSTFGLDVDTGSYTVGRRYLRDGHLPPPESVRVEEYVNYFDYGDPPPEKGDFAIHAEGAPSLYGEGERYYLLRFNLKGREIAALDRRPANLVFVVDVSGSMARENRLGLVKKALTLLLGELRAGDRVALVVYGTRGRVILEPTGDGGAIRRAIEELRPEGSTNAEEGLTLAYELAARYRRRGAINRVILCSDGVANVGRTSADSILERIRREAEQGIELTTVGFGMGNYNDELMERLADTGNGRYAYVDDLGEAKRIFVENLTGTLQTIAAEARVQVEFNPDVVSRYRLLGYENRDIADHRFRDDTVDAGEIGAGHTVTALYEIKLHRELKAKDEIGTLRLRWGSIDKGEMVETARTVIGADFARRFDDASPALRLTALVAEFAEVLKRSYWAREGDLDDVFRRAQKVSAELAGDREVADFVSLVGRAADLWERQQARQSQPRRGGGV